MPSAAISRPVRRLWPRGGGYFVLQISLAGAPKEETRQRRARQNSLPLSLTAVGQRRHLMGTSEENSETISRRGGQNSLDYYASSTILRNYPARQGIMPGNG